MGWGMCYCSIEREHKDYGYGDGVGHVLPFHRKMGMGMGWGMCYRSIEREHKDYGDGDGVGHVLPFHRKRTQGLWGWGWGEVAILLWGPWYLAPYVFQSKRERSFLLGCGCNYCKS